jgi:hypothetical protein
MFDGEHAGRAYFKGWSPILASLCAQIDLLLADRKCGFRWLRIGESDGDFISSL